MLNRLQHWVSRTSEKIDKTIVKTTSAGRFLILLIFIFWFFFRGYNGR